MTYSIIKATEKDGAQMRDLFEQTEMQAPIEMMLTRRPNVFLSYKKENESAEVFLIKSDNEIILQIGCLPHELLVDGKPVRAGYLCGLRKKPGVFRINYNDFIQEIFDECKCDIYYASIVDGNQRAVKLLTKGHKQLPAFYPLCKHTSFVFRAAKTKTTDEVIFRNANEEDNNRIENFIKEQRGEYNFIPVFNLRQFVNLSIDDFYLLEHNNEILCVCALWRQEDYKQYGVKRYNGVARIFSFLPAFPKVGEAIESPIISLLISKDENIKYYTEMLRRISNAIAPQSKLYTVGATQHTVLFDILSQRVPAARFDSTIYTLNTPSSNGKIHIEGGLL